MHVCPSAHVYKNTADALEMEKILKIDIIIPVYKPGRELFAQLDALEAQTLPVNRVILMNTEKRYFDELLQGVEFAARYQNVQVYHLPKKEFDHGGTRCRGVQHSDADIFVCMTQDAMPVDKHLLERLTARLSGDVGAAYARQLPGDKSSEFERISRYFNYPEDSRLKSAGDLAALGIKAFFCSNVCAAYRRDVYEELGGFVRHTIFNEDMIYAAGLVRAGYQIAYEAQAQVVHAHNYTNMQQLRRNFDLGVSQACHPEVFAAVRSESEGKKLVCAAWKYLKRKKRLYKFPGFCVQCCFKYMGFLLGKHYAMLPRSWVLKITANREYWGQQPG